MHNIITLNKVDEKEIKEMINMHVTNLPDSILSLTSYSYLRNLYISFIQNKNKTIRIIKKDGKIIAFYVFSMGKTSYISKLNISSFINLFLNILQNPKFIIEIFIQLYLSLKINSFELEHIIIKKKFRGLGIGKKLIKDFIMLNKQYKSKTAFTLTSNERLTKHYIDNYSCIINKEYRFNNKKFYLIKFKFNKN